MNRDCAMARDLMPLWADNVASEDSIEWLVEHVNTCEECTKVYVDMKSKEPEPVIVEEKVSFSAAMRQLRRTVVWKRTKYILLGLLTPVALFFLYIYGDMFLFGDQHYPLGLQNYEIQLSTTTKGTVLARTDSFKGYRSVPDSFFSKDTGIYYVYMTTSLIPQAYERRVFTEKTGLVLENGIIYQLHRPYGAANTDRIPVTEIRKGTESDYEVLYKAGDKLPLCSAEMDEYMRLYEAYEEEEARRHEAVMAAGQWHDEELWEAYVAYESKTTIPELQIDFISPAADATGGK